LDWVRAWVLVSTGWHFSEAGDLVLLNTTEKQQATERFHELGGDRRPRMSARDWHRWQAAAAEGEQHWFAAVFHLSRLLAEAPEDPDLLRRRADAQANLRAAAGRPGD